MLNNDLERLRMVKECLEMLKGRSKFLNAQGLKGYIVRKNRDGDGNGKMQRGIKIFGFY